MSLTLLPPPRRKPPSRETWAVFALSVGIALGLLLGFSFGFQMGRDRGYCEGRESYGFQGEVCK